MFAIASHGTRADAAAYPVLETQCSSYLRSAIHISVVLRGLLKGVLRAQFAEQKNQHCRKDTEELLAAAVESELIWPAAGWARRPDTT